MCVHMYVEEGGYASNGEPIQKNKNHRASGHDSKASLETRVTSLLCQTLALCGITGAVTPLKVYSHLN